jgi:hypothetical protein
MWVVGERADIVKAINRALADSGQERGPDNVKHEYCDYNRVKIARTGVRAATTPVTETFSISAPAGGAVGRKRKTETPRRSK